MRSPISQYPCEPLAVAANMVLNHLYSSRTDPLLIRSITRPPSLIQFSCVNYY